jgi:hypothetical protein
MRRLPAEIGPPGPWSSALLLAGLAASLVGLSRLTIAGFAPGGRLPSSPWRTARSAWPNAGLRRARR